jgi:hypothetical protein
MRMILLIMWNWLRFFWIRSGRGNVDLLLTEDQYNKLARKA